MDRRTFLGVFPAGVAALGWNTGMRLRESKLFSEQERTVLEKVLLAMLTMQRATWEQGVAMQALLELGEEELVILMAKDAVLRQSDDGRLAMLGEEFALTDACAPAEAVLWAAQKTGEQSFFTAIEKLTQYVETKAPRAPDGTVYHFTNVPQIWSDATYMLPPFLAVIGKYEEALKQIRGIKRALWNAEKKLLSHMWDYEKKTFARKDFWGVGNGWSAAGITRVLRMLPATMESEKKELIEYLNNIIDGCLTYLRPDGFFHNILDNSQSFVETNLSQMIAYSIYRGVKAGWLQPQYVSYANRMREAVLQKVDEYGLVQGVCGSPEFDHPGTATEGQAFFLMMETARAEL